MEKRIEHKKTIVFDSEEAKTLYYAITNLESSRRGITPSALVAGLVKEKYLPSDPDAEMFCKRLYLMDTSGEKLFDILGDIFVFLANKTDIERYSQNRCLFFWLSSMLKEDTRIEPQEYVISTFKKSLEKLGLHDADDSGQINIFHYFESPDSPYFSPKNLVQRIVGEWGIFAHNKDCYMSMSYLCRVLPDTPEFTVEGRHFLIGLIRSMSKHWDFASE